MLVPTRLRLPWLQQVSALILWERFFAARRGLDSSFDSAFDPAFDPAMEGSGYGDPSYESVRKENIPPANTRPATRPASGATLEEFEGFFRA
jgi:hypothetical protein